ncbi:hypothetical protein GIB67_006037 [Kingdonia uniflora]|uniref:Pentatricopeptide repeat-containing protein n=1 Tax=Kingdonia uniflora TaxID=39325 RepID=A0A7J7NTD1_9MAGN|nr:hypothetical protein GIB67_006037 [Kingdonia uniflora]
MSEAVKLVEELENMRNETDVFTYNTLIKGYCNDGELDTALKMCNVGLGTKGSVNVGPVQAVVDGLIKKSRIQEAKKLVELANKSRNPVFFTFGNSSGSE